MSKKVDFDTRLGDFALKYPQTKDVLKEFGLDYCCGSQKKMAVATEEKNIDWKAFKSALQKIINETPETEKTKNWEKESLTNIIKYIEKKHHVAIWEKLSSIEKLLSKLLDVHSDKHGEFLLVLENIFAELKEKLEKHLLKEEDIIFNYARKLEASSGATDKKSAAKNCFTKRTIKKLHKEHEEAGKLLRKMRSYTANYELPGYACLSFEALYEHLQVIEDDLFEHINLENTILLPRIIKLIEQE